MKYIEKVILENFQSHKYSVIEFDNSLNVIVGPSDSGKTAILRAIKWVLYNEPSGDYFIREGENSSSVSLIFSDNSIVQRFRSRSKNAYYIIKANGEEITLEGFGTGVPDEVKEITGIHKILFDRDVSSSINIGDQLEGAFLLSERNSVRSSSIGRLVGVNILDDALRDTLRDNKNLSQNKKNLENLISSLEEDLDSYSYLDEFKEKINKIELLKNIIEEKTKKLNFYKASLEKINFLNREKASLLSILSKLSKIDEVDGIIINIQRINTNISYLSSLNIKHQSNINEIKALQERIKKLPNIDSLNNIIDSITLLTGRLGKLERLNTSIKSNTNSQSLGKSYLAKFRRIDEIELLSKDISNKLEKQSLLIKLNNSYITNTKDMSLINHKLETYDKDISSLVESYKDLLVKLEVCPLCFSNIDQDRINHIVMHYKEGDV